MRAFPTNVIDERAVWNAGSHASRFIAASISSAVLPTPTWKLIDMPSVSAAA